MRGCTARRAVALAVVLAGALAAAGCVKRSDVGARSTPAPSEITVALSNSFIGNTWRQSMVRIFVKTARQAKADGKIKDYYVSNTAQNTATEQIAALNALILRRPSAILINSASPTALNPVITKACEAGIVVITFDSVASAPCEYNEQADLARFGAQSAEGVLKAMNGRGNVVVVRGVVGSAPEKTIYDAQIAEIKKYPQVKIVAELQGQASNPITQQSVQAALPSLPPIQGIITGGSTYGALQAYESAGRAAPFGNFSNDGTDLALWKQQLAKNPKYQATSVRPDPGQSALTFWIALAILRGEQVPKELTSPNLVITTDTLDAWTAVTPPSDTAAWQWTEAEAMAAIRAQRDGQPMPQPGIPREKP